MNGLDDRDLADLERAVMLLEHPGFVARVSDVVGQPIEKVVNLLPVKWSGNVQEATRTALFKLLDAVVRTMKRRYRGPAWTRTHKLMIGLSGAVGGAFGAPALAVELPISTSIILRSIADIARSEGEAIASIEARLACLEVFALGGGAPTDDGTETGYFAVRAALAKAVTDAAKHIAEKGVVEKGAPAIVRLISQIAARFGTVVSEKMAAQAVPIIGALGGATINLMFVSHFQHMARGHFTVRRLERQYGKELVRSEYERLARSLRP
jgi:hypothetical protein